MAKRVTRYASNHQVNDPPTVPHEGIAESFFPRSKNEASTKETVGVSHGFSSQQVLGERLEEGSKRVVGDRTRMLYVS